MSYHLETVKLLASGRYLEILEYISLKNYRKFTEIKNEFNLVNGEVTDYLNKLQTAGLVERAISEHTREPCGWKTTTKANEILLTVFTSIANFKGKISA